MTTKLITTRMLKHDDTDHEITADDKIPKGFDDDAPAASGPRLPCSKIKRVEEMLRARRNRVRKSSKDGRNGELEAAPGYTALPAR